MNSQNPHHLMYSGPPYYPQQYPGPGEIPLPRQDNYSNHNSPYSTPGGHAPPPYQSVLQERSEQVPFQSRALSFYPSNNVASEPRPFEHTNISRANPLGIDTDLHSSRYAPHGAPMAASKPVTLGWHDGPRYTTEGPFDHPLPPTRQMPPPSSPQHFTPRSQHAGPPSLPPPTPSSATNRDLPSITSFHPRPGSSMSISSMLGADPERPRDPPSSSAPYSLPSLNQGSQNTTVFSGASMSPPRIMSRHTSGEYPQITRARTPDKYGYSAPPVSRQHRSSSGGASSFGRFSVEDPHSIASSKAPSQRYGDPITIPFSSDSIRRPPEDFEHARRSSLSGPLPRPNSQPHPQSVFSGPNAFAHLPSREAAASEHRLSDSEGYSMRHDPPFAPRRQDSLVREAYTRDVPQRSPSTVVDHRPTYSGNARPMPFVEKTEERKPFNPWDSVTSSPNIRRIGQIEGVSSIPFESPSRMVTAPLEPPRRPSPPSYPGQLSLRPEPSTQVEKQSIPDQQEIGKLSQNSPFSTPSSHQQLLSYGNEEQNRRSVEEHPQHRSILNVANENKRGGRASPVPQAVQGAQAQIVGPEAAIKSEHGRVFSGIGGGIGAVTTGPVNTSTPSVPSASPFRREETTSRALGEDFSMKPSRSSSGVGKRGRRARDEESRLDSEPNEGRRTPVLPRGSKKVRPHSTVSAPHTYIKVKPIIESVSSHRRRHLGSFLYSPSFSVPDQPSSRKNKRDYSVMPNLLPAFTDEDQLNCTYTVRVSRTWLTDGIREAVWKERFLWGSGVYTDDSDPMAAAFHSGFVKAAWPDGTDIELLESIIKDQNPKIDFAENLPPSPLRPPADMDLHITLLVLPTLESYRSSTRFGMRSRDWPESEEDRGRHDGVSFAVLNCEFVDEGGSRGLERGGKARKERLKAKLSGHRDEVRRSHIFNEEYWPGGTTNRPRLIADL